MTYSRRNTIDRIIYLLNQSEFRESFLASGFLLRGKRLYITYVNGKASHSQINKFSTATLSTLHDLLIIAHFITPEIKRGAAKVTSFRSPQHSFFSNQFFNESR